MANWTTQPKVSLRKKVIAQLLQAAEVSLGRGEFIQALDAKSNHE